MVITVSVQADSDRIIYAGPDFLCLLWFCSFKEGLDHIVQKRPRSDLDGLVRVLPNTSGPEANWCARIIRPGSSILQLAHYQFPTFRHGCILPQTALIIWRKTSLDLICSS